MAEVAEQPEEVGSSDVLQRTVFVENLRTSVEKLAKLLKPVYQEKFGDGAVTALVRRRDGYEITFATLEAARECLDSGFQIEHRQYDAVSAASQDLVVSLVSVPAYVEDSAIVRKLEDLGCACVGEVRRHRVEGGAVETGRRRVTVRLPANLRSLPRTILVKSVSGRDERVEVFHRNQRIRKNTR